MYCVDHLFVALPQEVIREMVARSGALDVLKMRMVNLCQGQSSSLVSTATINNELENTRKRWENLSKEIQQR